jgi:adenylate cyclase
MKFPFHVTLMTLILGLLILTGAGIGLASYWNTRDAVEHLSQQVLGHAEKRIDQRVNQLLLTAKEQGELSSTLLRLRPFSKKDYPQFKAHWFKVTDQYPWFTSFGFTAEATGDALYVTRRGKSLEIVDSHWEPGIGRDNPITKEWYRKAKAAGKQLWADTGDFDHPGVACLIPVQREEGSLLGVFRITIDLYELCDSLKKISLEEEGFPFIVEYRKDQPRRVIAHPDSSMILHTVKGSNGKERTKLVEVRDERVLAFLNELDEQHPDLDPRDLKPKVEAELQDLTQVRFTHEGVAYRGTYRCLSRDDTPDWLICIVVPESSILARVEKGNRQTLFIVLGVGVVAVLLSLVVALQVARPLRRVAHQTEAIGQFHLAAEPVPHSIVKEVDRLAVAMEDMKTSLRSFRKFVPADVVRALLAAGQDASLGGERRTVTIYFSDIADFTSISERLTPEQLVSQLAEYLGAQSDQIHESLGTVDKYIGDAIMAFWGAPAVNPRHALAACTAAVRNQELLRSMRQKWSAENKPLFLTRIGLNTGEVLVGNIGSAARLNYTVIGDAVNLASRLEGLNKYYGTEILISESTYLEAQDGVVARPLDWVSVKGKTAGVLIYELLGLKGEVKSNSADLVEVYSSALASYRKQDWKRAIELFEQVLRIKPEDHPASQMIKRCQEYRATSPPEGWDGVHHMASK